MADLTLDTARKILDAAFAKAGELKLKPLVVTILDARGVLKLAAAQDGTSLMRADIAHGRPMARSPWAWARALCSSARRSRPISSMP